MGFAHLAASSASSRGTCELLWKKPRTRRIPAREWKLFMVGAAAAAAAAVPHTHTHTATKDARRA